MFLLEQLDLHYIRSERHRQSEWYLDSGTSRILEMFIITK